MENPEERDFFRAEVRKQFTYHPPKTDKQKEDHRKVNEAFQTIVDELIDVCPIYSSQFQHALNSLMEARMWSNASLAIHNNSVEEHTLPTAPEVA